MVRYEHVVRPDPVYAYFKVKSDTGVKRLRKITKPRKQAISMKPK
jgi:hypothetical protein